MWRLACLQGAGETGQAEAYMNSRIQRSPAVKRAAAEYLGERPEARVTVDCRPSQGLCRGPAVAFPLHRLSLWGQLLQHSQASRVSSCKGLYMYCCSHLCAVKPLHHHQAPAYMLSETSAATTLAAAAVIALRRALSPSGC